MARNPFTGAIPALMTPCTSQRKPDFAALARKGRELVDRLCALIRGHFELGGTQINMNVVDKRTILDAHRNPEKYPDLVVRVTGFSAYFSSLSPEFRQMEADRIVYE